MGAIQLLLGPDRGAKRAHIETFQKQTAIDPLDSHRLDGAALDARELLNFCRQQPAASSVRLVVVEDAHKLSAEAFEALQTHSGEIASVAAVFLCSEAAAAPGSVLTRARRFLETRQFDAGREFNPFALNDAIARRDAPGALKALTEQRLQGRDGIAILGTLSWQLQQWTLARRMLEMRYSPEAAAAVMHVKPWQARTWQDAVRDRPLAQLQSQLEDCLALDAAAKSGRGVPEWDLERFVVGLCG